MATRAAIRKRAAILLGWTTLNQGIRPEHDTRLSTAYTEIYDKLKDEGTAIWASSSDSVPDRVVPHIVTLMAHTCANEAGISNDRYARIMNDAGPGGALAMREIRSLVTNDYESLEEPADF